MKPFLLLPLACALAALLPSAVAADAPDAPPSDVVVVSHGKVESAFATGTGGSFLANALYKVQVSRRVAPGAVEIHVHDTDIFYIVEGSATFVTGGTPVDPKEVSPGQIHAKSIAGGTEHHLTKGDVIVIPNGIPHQFTEMPGPFLYFVVKVTQ